jgi:heat shock protein HtpX
VYSLIAKNKRQTFILFLIILLVLSIIGFGLGYLIFDYTLGFWFLGIIGLITLIVYGSSTNGIVNLMHGEELDMNNPQHKQLYNIVENLSITAGMPMPKVYVIPDSGLNAFATGTSPDKSVVGATQGLLDSLNYSELEAVMGHEISHIRNYDTRVNVMAYAIAFSLLLIGEMLLRTRGDRNPLPLLGLIILVVGYPVVLLTRLAISRQREYLADVSSIELTRNPEAMANALEKLKTGGKGNIPSSVSHMFMNSGAKEGWFSKIMSSHPPIDDRIERARNSFNSM